MKNSWLVLLLVLMMASMARAEISFDGPHYSSFNLGDVLNLAVTITHPNSLNGYLKASLACENSSLDYYLVPISLQAGIQKRVEVSELLIQEGMTGNCNVNVELLNNVRQSLEKSQSGKLLITSELRMDSKLSKINMKAGESFVASGSVRNIRGEKLNEGAVSLLLDGKEHLASIKNGEFGYEFILPGDYKSGSHKVIVSISDDSGNKAEKELDFNIEAVAKRLELNLNQDGYKPEELVIINAVLYDQANEKMNGEALLKMYNPGKDIVLQRTLAAGEDIEYNLPRYAEPGAWRIMANGYGLSVESSLDVSVIEQLDFVIDGQKVIITNIGNIVYKKPIELFLGESESLRKDTSLKPGETAIIDLSKEEIESGSYDLEVASGNNKKSFNNIDVNHKGRNLGEALGLMLPGTGKTVLGSEDDPIVNPYYAGLAAVAVSLLGYLGYKQVRRKRRFVEKTKTIQMREAEKMAREIKSKKEKVSYNRYDSEEDKQKALIEYRDRILAGIEKEKKEKEMAAKRAMIAARDEYKGPWQSTEKKYEVMKDDVKGEIRYEEKKDNIDEKRFADEEEDFTINEKKKKKDDESGYFNFFGD